jgi:predicted nucleic acid-binding protein
MIFLDSWVFIEYFSQPENNIVISLIENPNENIAISSVCLTEIKYRISKSFGIAKGNEIINLIESMKNITILPVTKEVAEFAADLRLRYYDKKHDLSFIDCVNLSTAILSNCEKLYTGDHDFEGINEIEIEIIR